LNEMPSRFRDKYLDIKNKDLKVNTIENNQAISISHPVSVKKLLKSIFTIKINLN